MRTLASLVIGSLLLVGCSVLYPSELQRAAAEAKRYPFVSETHHHAAGLAQDEFIEVIIDATTTAEQGTVLWCEALVPHGADDSNALVYADPSGPSYEQPDCGSAAVASPSLSRGGSPPVPLSPAPGPIGTPEPGWGTFAIEDPAVLLPVPDGWEVVPPGQFADGMERRLPEVPPADQKSYREYVADVRGGRFLAILSGARVIPDGSATVTVMLALVPGRVTPAEAASVGRGRIDAGVDDSSHTYVATPIDLAVGSGVRAISTSAADGYLASTTVGFYIGLADGRVLELIGTAPATDEGFVPLMDGMTLKMRMDDAPSSPGPSTQTP